MTDLRQAAQQALETLEEINELSIGENAICLPAEIDTAMDAIRTALEQQAEPSQWRDMVVVNLVREGVNKHKARELADHFATLPQQQAEPVARVAFENWAKSLTNYIDLSRFETGYSDCNTDYAWSGWQAALAQPQQQAEPVAWMDREGDLYKMPEIPEWAPPHAMLYTAPPQRQWQGLTDEEIKEIALDTPIDGTNFARAIEAKLKERNNG